MENEADNQRRRGRKARIVVLGSINMDFVTRVTRLPQPGETLPGHAFDCRAGGKGANQAVAIARLGADSTLIGCVGDDALGEQLIAGLRAEGVQVKHVRRVRGCGSGAASISVDAEGQNTIAVVPGANARLLPQDVRALEELIEQADALLMQLEVPLRTVAAAARIARRHKIPVILDCAPAPDDGLPATLRGIDILSPNQTEAASLTGLPCGSVMEAEQAARALIRRHDPGLVVIKLGGDGAIAHAGVRETLVAPAFPVRAIDATAAGDAFTAALIVHLAEGARLGESMRFACAAGALAATRAGAQEAMPTRAEVDRLLKRPQAKITLRPDLRTRDSRRGSPDRG
ncbi:MAG: ribokinase, partial [Verrucomicrobiales bacterium]|nr:ribokinase [Verrucomicrobiales bacterium]